MAKDFWDTKVTMHLTVKQKTNATLIELAKELNKPIKQIVESLLEESETYKNKLKELEEEGRFTPIYYN